MNLEERGKKVIKRNRKNQVKRQKYRVGPVRMKDETGHHSSKRRKVLDYNGIPESMLDLISIPEAKLTAWSWNDGAADHYLTPHRIIQMNILKAWSIQLQSVQGQRMVDWLDEYSVNCDAWDEFHIGDHGDPNAHTSSFLPLSPYSSSDTNISGSFKSGQPRPPISAAAEFRKGIKRGQGHMGMLMMV